MRLTRFTDYSLRTLVYLGKNTGNRVTISEISEVHDISKNHLMKVVSNLTRSGVVAARRGPGGGIRLNRAAGDISLGEIIKNTEKHLKDKEAAGLTPVRGTDALLHDCLQHALKAYLQVLDRFTLADLLDAGEISELKERAA